MKVSSKSGSENRVFLTATDFNGNQPPNALFGQLDSTKAVGGSRRDGSTNGVNSTDYSANTYVHFETIVDGTTVNFKADNNNLGSLTETWIPNYNTWWFSYTYWKTPNITGTVRNIKIKPL